MGSPIGTDDVYMEVKVNRWLEEINRMGEIGLSQPHAVFAALTHGLMSKWSFICRTVPGAGRYMKRVKTNSKEDIADVVKW